MYVSFERAVLGFLTVLGLILAITLFTAKPAPAPVSQPSVPSLIPPPLSCLCGTSKQATRPFSVVCPYCRNTLSVQPSATGSVVTGETIGATPPAKSK